MPFVTAHKNSFSVNASTLFSESSFFTWGAGNKLDQQQQSSGRMPVHYATFTLAMFCKSTKLN